MKAASVKAVISGKVKLSRTSGDGRENLLQVLGPGEMFGELSLFDPGPRLSTAYVVSTAEFISLAGNASISTVNDAAPCTCKDAVAKVAYRVAYSGAGGKLTITRVVADLYLVASAGAAAPSGPPSRIAQAEYVPTSTLWD